MNHQDKFPKMDKLFLLGREQPYFARIGVHLQNEIALLINRRINIFLAELQQMNRLKVGIIP